MSNLVIRADAACGLTVNATNDGQLEADRPVAIEVNPGDQWLECATPLGTVKRLVSVDAGKQLVVALEPSIFTRYRAGGDGTITDTKTGREWTE